MTIELTVEVQETQLGPVIVEESPVQVVEVLHPGPPGPPLIVEDDGTPVEPRPNINFTGFTVSDDPLNNKTIIAAPSSAVFSYVHNQASASFVWTINHNLGYRPSVELFDAGSQEFDGEVSHPTVNQAVVTLAIATAGFARLI